MAQTQSHICITDLPAFIIQNIAIISIEAWRAMLCVPQFARFTMTNRWLAESAFKSITTEGAFLGNTFDSFGERYPFITLEGNKWYKNGKLHREDDQPAVMWITGTNIWYKDGQMHREGDKPAVVARNGDSWWYRKGVLHRDDDGPAVIVVGEREEWWRNGVRHRDGDAPALVWTSGLREWYQNGVRHREGGAAWISPDGKQAWFKDGFMHRDGDQPAMIYPDGGMKWYKHGELHREGDRPAVDLESLKQWYKNNKLHRDGGEPAVIAITLYDDDQNTYGVKHEYGYKQPKFYVSKRTWYERGKYIKCQNHRPL